MVIRKVLPKSQNPFGRIQAPRKKGKVPRWFSWEELDSIFKAARGARNRALVTVLLDAGPRIGELGGLTKDNLVDGCLRVGGKTGERLIPLSPVVFAWLQELPTDALFPRQRRSGVMAADEPASAKSLRDAVVRVVRRAGLTGKKLGPHTFRHTFCTRYIARGGTTVELMKICGWTTSRMADRYVHLDTQHLVKVHGDRSPFNAMVLGDVGTVSPSTVIPNPDPVALPPEVHEVPLEIAGRLVSILVTQEHRGGSVFTYLKQSVGDGQDRVRKTLVRFGTGLPTYRPSRGSEEIRVSRERPPASCLL